MAEPTVLAVPIELDDAELDVVFGASPRVSPGVFGGLLTLGGGSGATTFSGTVTINTTTHAVTFAESGSGAYVLLIDDHLSDVMSSNGTKINDKALASYYKALQS